MDASALLLPALSDEVARAADSRTTLAELETRHGLSAPAIAAWEIGNVVHRRFPAAFGPTTETRIRHVRAILDGVELVEPDPESLARTGVLAEAHRLTFYDAAYVELAARHAGGVLLTEDGKMLDAARVALSRERAHTFETAAKALAGGAL